MRPGLVALGWIGAVAVGALVVLAHDRLDAAATDTPAAAIEAHLADQRVASAALALELVPDPLELRGTLRATVAGDAPWRLLHLVTADAVDVEWVRIDGIAAHETTPWLDALVATPRAHRRFDLAERTHGPAAQVEVRFRCALPGFGGEPLPAACRPDTLVLLAPDAELAELEVGVPAGLRLFTSGIEPGTVIERGQGRHALGAWHRGHAPLLLGHLAQRSGTDPLAAVRLVADEADLPGPAVEAQARQLLATIAVPLDRSARTLLFRRGIEPGALVDLGPGWFAVAPPRAPHDLAFVLLATGRAYEGANAREPLVAGLPAALVQQAVARAEEAVAGSAPALVALAPDAARGLRAWRVLESAFGARAREAESELHGALTASKPDEAVKLPDLLDDPAVLAIARWAQEGVAVTLEQWKVDVRRGRWVAGGELVVTPPPPRLPSPFPIALWFIGDRRAQPERIEVTGMRARFETIALAEPPRVVAIDPEGWLPHRSHRPPVVALDVAPSAFAVAPDGNSLAVALVRGGNEPLCGVSALRVDPEGATELLRWQPTSAPVRLLEWVVPGRYLALRETAGETRLVDLSDGSIQSLEGEVSIAPRGGFVLESSERAPGCFAHALHDVAGGLSSPLPVARRGPAQWIANSDELLTTAADGRAVIVDAHGRERAELPLLRASLRALDREAFGWVAALDTATGGRVDLFDLSSRPLRSFPIAGRVRGVSFSADNGVLLIFVQAGAGDHRVVRAELDGPEEGTVIYRGADRPLPSASSKRGLVLVAADSDLAPANEPRRLLFAPFETLARAAEAPKVLCAEAFLEPPPVLASAGRYLYYLRAHGGPRGLPGDLKPKALFRYDFLTGREEPLAPTTTEER